MNPPEPRPQVPASQTTGSRPAGRFPLTNDKPATQEDPHIRANDARKLGPNTLKRLLLDMAVGATLLLAVLFVWALDARRSTPAGQEGETRDVASDVDPAGAPNRSLRLAVTPPEHDDMGHLLDTLGRGYRYEIIPMADLLEPQRLAPFDVVFLTCGGVPTDWLGQRVGTSERSGGGLFRPRPEIVEKIRKSFRAYVGHGGTFYVSDFQFDLLTLAFGEHVDPVAVGKGAVQAIEAEVVDPGLEKLLGPSVPLRFEMPGWRPAAFAGPEVTVYLRGRYALRGGGSGASPLLVSFPFGEGTVVYTSFHNEQQNSDIELALLRHLVFTTVTARETGKIERTMVHGGFSPSARSLLSASGTSQPVSDDYICPRRGPLQFVLGFSDQGARLRLTVTGPGGDTFQKTGTHTFRIDIPDAQPGRWRYTITPTQIPYNNFPYTLTIGRRASEP